MEIGEPEREIIVEPIPDSTPAPAERPAPVEAPEREPVTA